MKFKGFVLIMFAAMVITSMGISGMLNKTYLSTEKMLRSELPVELSQTYSESSNKNKLNALLKGSIYETGEEMTVYGACFDGYSYLIPESNATFKSWYANGTIWEGEDGTLPMIPVLDNESNPTGRFRYQVNMTSVMGTYLTEITCHYDGDYALAFGEWQNPQWVKRIKDTQDSIIGFMNISSEQYANITTQINNFQSEVQSNFSQVLLEITSMQSEPSSIRNEDIASLYNMIHAVDTSFWAIDQKAPWYSFGSNTFNFRAVDMLSPSDIYAVSDDGYIVSWDGETWSVVRNDSNEAWYGVSVLPASTPYGWAVGKDKNTNTSVYSINGGTPAALNATNVYASTKFTDIKLFPDPNRPSSNFMGVIAGVDEFSNTGEIFFSSDSGNSWDVVTGFGSSDVTSARISQIISNTDLGVTRGFRAAVVGGSGFVYINGSDVDHVTLAGSLQLSEANQNFADVDLVYEGLGYAVSKDTSTNQLKIWQFNGTALSLVYVANDTTIEPKGIAAIDKNDIWVVTNNPSVYYHYDGFKWEYANYPYSGAISLSILFTNGTIPGLYDINAYNAKNAYAVGTDGIIMKLYSQDMQKMDDILVQISNITIPTDNSTYNLLLAVNDSLNNLTTIVNSMDQTIINMNQNVSAIVNTLNSMDQKIIEINGTVYNISQTVNSIDQNVLAMNLTLGTMQTTINNIDQRTTAMNQSLEEIKVMIVDMNASISLTLSDILSKVNDMNSSLNIKLDTVIANMTYMQLYLETTMYPMMNETYQNTLTILSQLGIISGKIDTNINLTNQTLIIANDTKTGVDELVNKSRKIKAWITI